MCNVIVPISRFVKITILCVCVESDVIQGGKMDKEINESIGGPLHIP